jgi:hypothetical protein
MEREYEWGGRVVHAVECWRKLFVVGGGVGGDIVVRAGENIRMGWRAKFYSMEAKPEYI